MAFRVEIAPRAVGDLDAIAGYIKEYVGFEQAKRWFNGILEAIRSLSGSPGRCPLLDSEVELGRPVRVLLHGKTNRQYKV